MESKLSSEYGQVPPERQEMFQRAGIISLHKRYKECHTPLENNNNALSDNLFADKAFAVWVLEHLMHVRLDWSLGSFFPKGSKVNN